MIRKALTKEAAILTKLSFASKEYWGYPKEYFAIWENELTITEEYIEKNDVFVYQNDRQIMAYYSLVFLDEDIEISNIVLQKGVWLEHMFVLPQQIGKGVGTELFAHLTKYCLEKNIVKVGVLSDPHARGFYEKMGCVYVGEFPSTIEGRTTPFLEYHTPK